MLPKADANGLGTFSHFIYLKVFERHIKGEIQPELILSCPCGYQEAITCYLLGYALAGSWGGEWSQDLNPGSLTSNSWTAVSNACSHENFLKLAVGGKLKITLHMHFPYIVGNSHSGMNETSSQKVMSQHNSQVMADKLTFLCYFMHRNW